MAIRLNQVTPGSLRRPIVESGSPGAAGDSPASGANGNGAVYGASRRRLAHAFQTERAILVLTIDAHGGGTTSCTLTPGPRRLCAAQPPADSSLFHWKLLPGDERATSSRSPPIAHVARARRAPPRAANEGPGRDARRRHSDRRRRHSGERPGAPP